VVTVTGENQGASDHMVGKHLEMIFPPLLNINNKYLLKPKGKLHKVVPFEQTGHFSIGPVHPELAKIQPIVRIIEKILSLDLAPLLTGSAQRAHHA